MKNEKLPAWDLSDLFNGIDDEKITKGLEKYKKFCANFAKRYKGKLKNLDGAEFAAMLKEYEKNISMASKIGGFAYLNMVTQMKNQQAMAFYQDISEKLTDYGKPLVFLSLEINSLDKEKISSWLKNKEAAFYKPWLERLRRFKKYELSEEVEEVLIEKSLTSSSAWVRLYEETSSKLVYKIDGKTYNDAEISKLLLESDENIRLKVGKEINRVAMQNADLFTFIYNMVIKDKAIEDEKRGFKRPVSSRNMSENVSDKTVDALAESVRMHYRDIAHRFYKLKAKWLKKDKISYWDRNAPLPFSADCNYSWEETVEIVLNAYKKFSPRLYAIAKDFFTHNWIDVPPRDGKRSGAFCAPVFGTRIGTRLPSSNKS